MLISVCTPVMNRTDDLRQTMPHRIEAAVKSLPIEYVILSYNSQDDLHDYILGEVAPLMQENGILLTFREFKGRRHYHQAHAYNLSVKASMGKYIIVLQADTYPVGDYYRVIRCAIQDGYEWMEPKEENKSVVCCKRELFYGVGGFDERFEFYGPEDRDLSARLNRSGAAKFTLADDLLVNIPTPNPVKVANYRIKRNKTTFSRMMRSFYEENNAAGVVRANKGKEWGKWS